MKLCIGTGGLGPFRDRFLSALGVKPSEERTLILIRDHAPRTAHDGRQIGLILDNWGAKPDQGVSKPAKVAKLVADSSSHFARQYALEKNM